MELEHVVEAETNFEQEIVAETHSNLVTEEGLRVKVEQHQNSEPPFKVTESMD